MEQQAAKQQQQKQLVQQHQFLVSDTAKQVAATASNEIIITRDRWV